MPTYYNIDAAKIDLSAIQGDSICFNFKVTGEIKSTGIKIRAELFNVPEIGTLLNMTSLQITVRRKDGLIVKSWISGVTPANITIGISGGDFIVSDSDGFPDPGFFDYDCQVTDVGGIIGTILYGTFHVKKQITP